MVIWDMGYGYSYLFYKIKLKSVLIHVRSCCKHKYHFYILIIQDNFSFQEIVKFLFTF